MKQRTKATTKLDLPDFPDPKTMTVAEASLIPEGVLSLNVIARAIYRALVTQDAEGAQYELIRAEGEYYLSSANNGRYLHPDVGAVAFYALKEAELIKQRTSYSLDPDDGHYIATTDVMFRETHPTRAAKPTVMGLVKQVLGF